MASKRRPLTKHEQAALADLVPRFEKQVKRGRNAETPRVLLGDLPTFLRLRSLGLVRVGVIAEPTEEGIALHYATPKAGTP
jgi:hypothetical protein